WPRSALRRVLDAEVPHHADRRRTDDRRGGGRGTRPAHQPGRALPAKNASRRIASVLQRPAWRDERRGPPPRAAGVAREPGPGQLRVAGRHADLPQDGAVDPGAHAVGDVARAWTIVSAPVRPDSRARPVRRAAASTSPGRGSGWSIA